MNDKQWHTLLELVDGKTFATPPIGFIIDSPWLPGWFGCRTIDYYTSETVWFDANRKAIEAFPDALFLPGFWSEFGMCTEPSAFGAKCVWQDNDLPHAAPLIQDADDLADLLKRLKKPHVGRDGLLPFILNRLRQMESKVHSLGHAYRFAVARGPLNIASFLLGTTEFLTAVKIYPEETLQLLRLITDFLKDWLELQCTSFSSIDGILLLDDLMGFLGKEDMEVFVVPFFRELFKSTGKRANFLHNDAHGLVCAPYLKDMGVNLFNFSYNHSLSEMRSLVGNEIVLMGNLPPLDSLVRSQPEQVEQLTRERIAEAASCGPVLLSAGGGMPQGVPTANLKALIRAASTGAGL